VPDAALHGIRVVISRVGTTDLQEVSAAIETAAPRCCGSPSDRLSSEPQMRPRPPRGDRRVMKDPRSR
jgi:hypothetical protein